MNGALGILRGVEPAGIGEEANVACEAIFQAAAHVAEPVSLTFAAVGGTAANHRVRSEVPAADRVTEQQVAGRGPFCGLASAGKDVFLNTESDELGEVVADTETAAPCGARAVVEQAGCERNQLKLVCTEQAGGLDNDLVFEGFG